MHPVPFVIDVELTDQVFTSSVTASLGDELSCPVLEELCPNLNFFVRKSSSNIDAVHKQLQQGRKIVLTENPNMHLVRSHEVIYIKPIPHHLLSHSFWSQSFAPGSEHRRPRRSASCVRTSASFATLRISSWPRRADLVPSCSMQSRREAKTSTSDMAYADFEAFIRSFSNISDAERGLVSRLFYEGEFLQIRQVLKESAAPLLFVFAALSLILSAMQVVLTAKQGDYDGGWRAFAEVSAWFSVLVIALVAVLWPCVVSL
ncbi:hypothetical protein LX36DRAFT_698585 [Colletotrichum falcatum]|nr:hypothetical protein LX36DRAFT_698585 [Colletotrichum falcatum]